VATSPIATQSEILLLPPVIRGGILLAEAETSSPSLRGLASSAHGVTPSLFASG
jgi:hypothetical protein